MAAITFSYQVNCWPTSITVNNIQGQSGVASNYRIINAVANSEFEILNWPSANWVSITGGTHTLSVPQDGTYYVAVKDDTVPNSIVLVRVVAVCSLTTSTSTTSTTSTTTSTSTSTSTTSTTTLSLYDPIFAYFGVERFQEGGSAANFISSYGLNKFYRLDIVNAPPLRAFVITGTTPTGVFNLTGTTDSTGEYNIPSRQETVAGILDLTLTFAPASSTSQGLIKNGLIRKYKIYFGEKQFIARLRKNSTTGPVVANSQIVSIQGRGISSLSPGDIRTGILSYNTKTDVTYTSQTPVFISNTASVNNVYNPENKQFIVKLRRGSIYGPVVATSQIINVLGLGNRGFINTDLSDRLDKFEVVSGFDTIASISKSMSNIGYAYMTTTTSSTTTSTTSSTTTQPPTSTTSTSTSTSTTSTSTSTSTTSTTTAAGTSTTTSTSTSTSTSSSTTSTTTLPPTSTTTTLSGWTLWKNTIDECFIIGQNMVFNVESETPSTTFFITVTGTGQTTPMSAGPLITNATETYSGSGRYAAQFNLTASALGLCTLELRPNLPGAYVVKTLDICIIQITSTTSTSTSTTTTTTLPPLTTSTSTSTSTTSTTTSAAPFLGTSTTSSTSTSSTSTTSTTTLP